MKNTASYNFVNLTRKDNTGGGICTGIHKSLMFRDISEQIPDWIKESIEILMV